MKNPQDLRFTENTVSGFRIKRQLFCQVAHNDNTLLQSDGLKASSVMHPPTSNFGLQLGSRWDYKRCLPSTQVNNHLLLYVAKHMRPLYSVTSGVLTVQQHYAPCIENTWRDQARKNRITSLAQHEYSSHCSLLYPLEHFNYMRHSLKYWHSCSVNIRYVYVFCTILTVNGDYFPEHINWNVFTVVLDCEPREIRNEFFCIV